MDGLRINGVALLLGKIPGRKQECFYFEEDEKTIPVAYISKDKLVEAKRLWGKMINPTIDCDTWTASSSTLVKVGLVK